jgi:predicted nucleic acid-binding protein
MGINLSSNAFDFKSVFENRVQDGGKSTVLFINGIFTTYPDYQSQASQLSTKLNLLGNQDITINNEVFSGGIQYQFAGENEQYEKYYNESDFTGNLVVDIGLPILRGLSVGVLVFALSSLNPKVSAEKIEEIIEKAPSVKWSNIDEALKFLQEAAGFDAAGLIESGLKGAIDKMSKLAELQAKSIDEDAIFRDAEKIYANAWQAFVNAGNAVDDILRGDLNGAQRELEEAKRNYEQTMQEAVNLLGNASKQYGSAWEEYFKEEQENGFIKGFLETFAPVFDGLISGKNPVEDADFSKAVLDTIISVFTTLPAFKNIPAVKIVNAVYEGVIAALPEDIKEAFGQFWFSGIDLSADNLNNKWTNDVTKELEKPQYSLMAIGYSQGNFFFEDAFKGIGNVLSNENARIFALGSPTSYLAVGGLEAFNKNSDFNIRNDNDPIAKLQFLNDLFTDKLRSLFSAFSTAATQGIAGHDFGGYVNNPRLKEGFKASFHELHPQGYYFAEQPIEASISSDGTQDDDWIQGGNSNDLLSGLSCHSFKLH